MANGRNDIQRKTYSSFTANAAKNIVKKKLLEIRKGGARAADELMDRLLKSDEKSRNNSSDQQTLAEFERMARSAIDKYRGKWRNFIIEAAMRFDPDALACFGVNFIYGGLITASVGNVGWASVAEVGENVNSSQNCGANTANKNGGASNRGRAVSEILSKGRARGNMVWILKGKGLFEPEMLKTYRFEPDIAFILLEEPDKNGVWSGPESISELSRLKNVLSVIPERSNGIISDWSSRGMLYAVSSFDKRPGEGNRAAFSADLTRGALPPAIDRFIKEPSFPIRAEGMISLFDGIEYILSDGRSDHIPEYRIQP